MAVSKTAQLAIAGVAVVVVIVVALMFFRPPLAGDARTTVFLKNDGNGGCVIDETRKEKTVHVGDNRQMIWDINHDDCEDKQELVTVGNFRRSEASTADNCQPATHGADGIWIFAQPEALQQRQSHAQIPLTTKGRNDLERGEYYYDICAGRNAEKKSDPMLVIEY